MTDHSGGSAADATARYIARGRTATGLTLLASLATDVMSGDGWFEAVVLATGVGLILVGLVTLLTVRVGRKPRRHEVLNTTETTLFAALLLVGVDEEAAYVAVMALLMLVLAGLRGHRAFRAGLWVAMAAEVGRQALTPLVAGDRIEVTESLIGIGVAAAMGSMVARLVDLARTSEQAARHSEEAATTALHEAEQAMSQLDTLHRVVVSAIGSSERDAAQRIVKEIASALDVPFVSVMTVDDPARARILATTNPDFAGDDVIVPLPLEVQEGSFKRVLAGETVLATPRELAALGPQVGPRGALSVHPLRSASGAIVGVLTCSLPEGRTFTGRQAETLARFADQTSLAIEAARSLDREADLANRYRELDRLKTDFIAITSHELRTPLTTVLGVVEMLGRRDQLLEEGDRAQLIDALRRQTLRLERLVDDLRTVSTVDAGTLMTQTRPTDVTVIVSETVESLFDIDSEVAVDGRVPRAQADPERLAQVVTNLVVNGEQHGEGTVHLRVSTEGDEVVLSVWDDGPGIPVDRRVDVFDRFVRLGDPNAHSRGTGLGLAIARDLTEAMLGTIAVVDHGQGSAFEVRLPAVAD